MSTQKQVCFVVRNLRLPPAFLSRPLRGHPPPGGGNQVYHYFSFLTNCKSAAPPGGAFPYFFPKLTAQIAAVKGTASMTPMELATPEMASRLM